MPKVLQPNGWRYSSHVRPWWEICVEPVALGLKDPGIKPLNLHRDCWRISKMKVFFGQKNTKYIAWSKEREATMLAPLVPKTWDQPTWKHTHFTNNHYFGFPKKKPLKLSPTIRMGGAGVQKSAKTSCFLVFFLRFQKLPQNGNRRKKIHCSGKPRGHRVRPPTSRRWGSRSKASWGKWMDGTGNWMATIR